MALHTYSPFLAVTVWAHFRVERGSRPDMWTNMSQNGDDQSRVKTDTPWST